MTLLAFNEQKSRSLVLSVRATALVFEDPVSQRLLKQIERIAPSDATVLIIGETGTGKELVARHIHECLRHHEGHVFPSDLSAPQKGKVKSLSHFYAGVLRQLF